METELTQKEKEAIVSYINNTIFKDDNFKYCMIDYNNSGLYTAYIKLCIELQRYKQVLSYTE